MKLNNLVEECYLCRMKTEILRINNTYYLYMTYRKIEEHIITLQYILL